MFWFLFVLVFGYRTRRQLEKETFIVPNIFMSIITPSIVLILYMYIYNYSIIATKNILKESELYFVFFITWILIIKNDLVLINYDKINCSVIYSLQ